MNETLFLETMNKVSDMDPEEKNKAIKAVWDRIVEDGMKEAALSVALLSPAKTAE